MQSCAGVSQVELLNETSFDRRRQVAVYKNDGKRGHHMQVRALAQPPWHCDRLAFCYLPSSQSSPVCMEK